MNSYNCAVCCKPFQRYASQVSTKTPACSKICLAKQLRTTLLGKNNPNYKKGQWISNALCSCGAPMDARSIRCAICANRGFPKNNVPRVSTIKLKECVANHISVLQVAAALGISRGYVSSFIKENNVDTAHFQHGRGRPIPTKQLLTLGKQTRRGTVKLRILSERLLPHLCASCGLTNIWKNTALVLDLHHKNGNSADNRLTNLEFLCPNCHSQTTNNKGKHPIRKNSVNKKRNEHQL